MHRWKTKEISRTLTNEIIAGKYPKGSLLPTRTTLAKRFSVARATIDSAVSDLVAAGMIQSRRGAGSIIINTIHQYRFAFIGNSPISHTQINRNDITFFPLPTQSLSTKAAREQLRQFDGIIWNMPQKNELQWATTIQNPPPQIVINRTPPNLNYVSTDHTNAIFQITNERLTLHPNWIPVFLNLQRQGLSDVLTMRQEGFIKACRKHNIFYELINMPRSFENKINTLQKQFNKKEKLIIVSGALENSGAVITWARTTNKQWEKNLLYSDFDNSYEENIWGITVTSFIQDFNGMLDIAISGLIDIIQKKKKQIKILKPPLHRAGNT